MPLLDEFRERTLLPYGFTLRFFFGTCFTVGADETAAFDFFAGGVVGVAIEETSGVGMTGESRGADIVGVANGVVSVGAERADADDSPGG